MKTKTPTPQEIIEIMKEASEALAKFNNAHRNLDFPEEIEEELESCSSDLRHHATTLYNRIIFK